MNDDVSRGTPSPPESARGVFGPERLDLAERYAELLRTEGVLRGLIGPREAPRLWDRHLLNCAVLGEAVPEGVTVCDVGSGAGLPGLVLAIARPDLRITLVEPLLRRTSFLLEVVDGLGLAHVEVVRGRAEMLHGRRAFDVVTSRAVAPLGRLLEWSMPLVAPDGCLVAMKGASIQAECVDALPVLERLGCGEPSTQVLGAALLAEPTVVVRVPWADPTRVSSGGIAGSGRSGGRATRRSSGNRRTRRR